MGMALIHCPQTILLNSKSHLITVILKIAVRVVVVVVILMLVRLFFEESEELDSLICSR